VTSDSFRLGCHYLPLFTLCMPAETGSRPGFLPGLLLQLLRPSPSTLRYMLGGRVGVGVDVPLLS